MIKQFISRKIKLIYKLIYQTKASKREEFFYKNILPQKNIEEVREDVEKWARQRSAEIELLQKNNINKAVLWCEKFKIPCNKFTDKINMFLPIFKEYEDIIDIELLNENT
jgi:hypothetical protein